MRISVTFIGTLPSVGITYAITSQKKYKSEAKDEFPPMVPGSCSSESVASRIKGFVIAKYRLNSVYSPRKK